VVAHAGQHRARAGRDAGDERAHAVQGGLARSDVPRAVGRRRLPEGFFLSSRPVSSAGSPAFSTATARRVGQVTAATGVEGRVSSLPDRPAGVRSRAPVTSGAGEEKTVTSAWPVTP
jgi:hypothetical protein